MATAVAQDNSPQPQKSDPVLVRRASQIKQQVVSIVTSVTTHIKESFTRENIAAFIRWLPTISRNWMLGTSIAVCLAILFLPSICDETYMPAFLTLSVHHKVIAAYVLGLLTAVILKT